MDSYSFICLGFTHAGGRISIPKNGGWQAFSHLADQ
jgi:hypothetical protein